MHGFNDFLKEFDFSESDLIAWMKEMDKYNLLEVESKKYHKSESKVHGIGIFASDNISKGDVVGAATIGDQRLTIVRWINHSDKPNVEFIELKDKEHPSIKAICIAKENLNKNDELLVDYRHERLDNEGM